MITDIEPPSPYTGDSARKKRLNPEAYNNETPLILSSRCIQRLLTNSTVDLHLGFETFLVYILLSFFLVQM